jgi:hypothetical protein
MFVIEEFKFNEVSRGELSRFNVHVSEKTGCFEDSDNVGGANVGFTVTWLYALVEPAIFFRQS